VGAIDLNQAASKALKASAIVLADAQNALLKNVLGGGSDDGAIALWEADRPTTKEITIPNGVTKIGSRAFYGCEQLREIIIPDGVKSIGELAFTECIECLSISIPASVESIGDYAFFGAPVHCDFSIEKTIAEVKAMANYPFGLREPTAIRCTDGGITVGHE
jgi:hypothetical protein